MDNSSSESIAPIRLPPDFKPSHDSKWVDWTNKCDGSVGKLTAALNEGSLRLPNDGAIVFSKRKNRFYLFIPGNTERKNSASSDNIRVDGLRATRNAAMQNGDNENHNSRLSDLLISQLHQIKEAAIQADDLEKAIAVKRQILALEYAPPPTQDSMCAEEKTNAKVEDENQLVMNQLDILFSDLNSPADATKAWTREASSLFAKIFAMHCSLQILVSDSEKITNSIPKSKNHKGALHKIKVRKSVLRDLIKCASKQGKKVFNKRLRLYLRKHSLQTKTQQQQADIARAHTDITKPNVPAVSSSASRKTATHIITKPNVPAVSSSASPPPHIISKDGYSPTVEPPSKPESIEPPSEPTPTRIQLKKQSRRGWNKKKSTTARKLKFQESAARRGRKLLSDINTAVSGGAPLKTSNTSDSSRPKNAFADPSTLMEQMLVVEHAVLFAHVSRMS